MSSPKSEIKVRIGPAGVHLFDRVSGLNVLLDEVKVPEDCWAAAPRQVSVALTNVCDLSCPYCYAPKNSATLDFDRLVDWLVELDANGCLGIGFGGGEPTLYRRFAELCRFITQTTQLAVTFTTHGHHLNDKYLAALQGNVNFVRISMDGIGKTYEMLRGKSFENLRRQLETIQFLVPFGINFVVNEKTLPDLDAAITIANETGAQEFLLLPEQTVRGRGGIDTKTAEALRQWVIRYQGDTPLTVSEFGATGMPFCTPFNNELGLQGYAHIDASGILRRSSYHEQGLSIGTQGVIKTLDLLKNNEQEGGQ